MISFNENEAKTYYKNQFESASVNYTEELIDNIISLTKQGFDININVIESGVSSNIDIYLSQKFKDKPYYGHAYIPYNISEVIDTLNNMSQRVSSDINKDNPWLAQDFYTEKKTTYKDFSDKEDHTGMVYNPISETWNWGF